MGLRDREAALIEGLADDHPREALQVCLQAELRELPEILDASDASGIEEMAVFSRPRDPDQILKIQASEHPVTIEVGVRELLHAALRERREHLPDADPGGPRPALDRDLATTGVHRDDDALGSVLLERSQQQHGVGERRRAE